MDAEELRKSILEYLEYSYPSSIRIHIEERIKILLPYFILLLSSLLIFVIIRKNPELSIENILTILFITIVALIIGIASNMNFDTKVTRYKLIKSFLDNASCDIVNLNTENYSWIAVIFYVGPKEIKIFENKNMKDELRKIIRKFLDYDYLIELRARHNMFYQSSFFIATEIKNVFDKVNDNDILIEGNSFEELKIRIRENKIEVTA